MGQAATKSSYVFENYSDDIKLNVIDVVRATLGRPDALIYRREYLSPSFN